jgi:hypothetical protein
MGEQPRVPHDLFDDLTPIKSFAIEALPLGVLPAVVGTDLLVELVSVRSVWEPEVSRTVGSAETDRCSTLTA